MKVNESIRYSNKNYVISIYITLTERTNGYFFFTKTLLTHCKSTLGCPISNSFGHCHVVTKTFFGAWAPFSPWGIFHITWRIEVYEKRINKGLINKTYICRAGINITLVMIDKFKRQNYQY